ncbi:glutamate-1-semialdehyde 2,1-aminomutase [Hoeflea sp. BAL378]|uniref:aminotransferase class III-fold pyridoxal phosphate-dependent enzyme n=1 Tax=Hoeflea sp. BAL378 TaxID=1547437 RepID=UPI000513FD0E|nr:aspartate aminotransferase family protein [Hoeflea sp. BAL378]KGF69062.1 glutamate-1-semialdehyde 2,1-aminomutase [Hoeflea sp. BAL378]
MHAAPSPSRASIDQALRERSQVVIPGGMWGHQRAAAVPAGFPQFFMSGNGATVRDVDGRDYIDFMCSWGPIILGHRHPGVEEAVRRQLELGECFDGPTENAVVLAETLVGMIPHASWALFQKNGSDAMTSCVTIARAFTGRRKVLVAKDAYHGAVPWCSPSLVGVTSEDRAHIIHFTFNDTRSLEAAAAQAGDDLAAVIVSGFKHDIGRTQELPEPEFAKAARALCDQAGAALIVDDVRAGFRLDLGGSWELTGVRPDLSAYSKAIANGHALSAVAGNDRFREAAARIFVTGSFWYGGAAMAASIATLNELKRLEAPRFLKRAGTRFANGLREQAQRHGFQLNISGPPAMPVMLFEDDPDAAIGEIFCLEALKRGVYLHHRHNMFLSLAHTDEVIDRALDGTEGAFAALAGRR